MSNCINFIQILNYKEAYNQVQRYHKTSFHGLFDYIQLFVISNGVNTRYFANNPNGGYKFTFNWTDKNNHLMNDLSLFATDFLDKCTLGKVISKYIVLHEGDKCLMVLRPYQYYAVEEIINRVENTNKNGYVWHTTGAGKTLTSFKAAQLVSEIDGVDKVMFVVDRHDLDTQTQSEYEAFEPGAVDNTDNTYQLIKRLSGKSKIIITTIQKLNCAVKKDYYNQHLQALRDKKIVMIFDECHRSQFGESHKNIVNFFKNHQIFGFTGTPIFVENAKQDKTTKEIFGECLHKYLIKDAIADENVLGFLVEYYQGQQDVDMTSPKRMKEAALTLAGVDLLQGRTIALAHTGHEITGQITALLIEAVGLHGPAAHLHDTKNSDGAQQRAAGAAAADAGAKTAHQLADIIVQAQVVFGVGGQHHSLGTVALIFQIKMSSVFFQHCKSSFLFKISSHSIIFLFKKE